MPQGMLFIDRNGEKYEPELVNAILNGVEIDTKSQYQPQKESEEVKESLSDKTIDI